MFLNLNKAITEKEEPALKQLILMLALLLIVTGPTWAQITDQQKAIVIRSALMDEEDWPVDLVVEGQHNFFWPNKTKYTDGLKKAYDQKIIDSQNGKVILKEEVTDEQLLAIPEFNQLANDTTVSGDKTDKTGLGLPWIWLIIIGTGVSLIALVGLVTYSRQRTKDGDNIESGSSLVETEENGDLEAKIETFDIEPIANQAEKFEQLLEATTKQAELAQKHASNTEEIQKTIEETSKKTLANWSNLSDKVNQAKNTILASKETLEVLATTIKNHADTAEAAALDANEASNNAARAAQEVLKLTEEAKVNLQSTEDVAQSTWADIEKEKAEALEILVQAKEILAQIQQPNLSDILNPPAQKGDPKTFKKPVGPTDLTGPGGGLIDKEIKPVKHPPDEKIKQQWEEERAKKKNK